MLLWDPPWLPGRAAAGPPLVLLDASLSLGGTGGRWREALDSARRIAGDAGVIWRFGADPAAFDTLSPRDGASNLAPALAAAAARSGPVTVITDGEIADVAALVADLRARPRVVTVPRPPFADAYIARVSGRRRLAAMDTLRLEVTVGVAGSAREADGSGEQATIAVRLGDRQLVRRPVTLPHGGTIVVELEVPAARLPAGPAALTVALDGAEDAEPRDDERVLVVETAARPTVVVLADPPDWEVRFLARTLADVVRAPVRTFVRIDRDGGWRDGATLRPVGDGEVERTVARARLLVHGAGRVPRAGAGAARLVLAPGDADGDWYLTAVSPSPLAAGLTGVGPESLPPLTAVATEADTGVVVALAAARARRGRAMPVVTLREENGARVATVAASGLWRWGFRGGAPEVAYRALIAGLADWLLEQQGAVSRERFAPTSPESPRGLPLAWRWRAAGVPPDVVLRLDGPEGERRDTLRFDAAGRAELLLPPGIYRYTAVDGLERGLVAVEEYSDEWRPASVTLAPQPGTAGGPPQRRRVRDTWWLFALAIAAFAAEWYWRRREGLP